VEEGECRRGTLIYIISVPRPCHCRENKCSTKTDQYCLGLCWVWPDIRCLCGSDLDPKSADPLWIQIWPWTFWIWCTTCTVKISLLGTTLFSGPVFFPNSAHSPWQILQFFENAAFYLWNKLGTFLDHLMYENICPSVRWMFCNYWYSCRAHHWWELLDSKVCWTLWICAIVYCIDTAYAFIASAYL